MGTGEDWVDAQGSAPAAVPTPAVVVLGGTNVVPPLMSALHSSGIAATWAVDAAQATQLLDMLPGSPVIVTDDSAAGAVEHDELTEAHVIDVRGVVSSTDHTWASTVAPLIASALPSRVRPSRVARSRVEPGRVEPARVEPSRVEPSHLEPSRVEPARESDPPVDGLVVDEHRWCVRYRGRPLRLTDAQYRLLARLVHGESRLVPLQELAHYMFDSSHCERQRIHAHVKRLRVRLAQETDGRFSIIAVRGMGYRLSDDGAAPPTPGRRSEASSVPGEDSVRTRLL